MDPYERVEEWADEIYERLGKETTWQICENRCPEEGCPPVETVLVDLSVKKASPGNGVYKIFKKMADVTQADVEQALSNTGKGTGHGGGHGDGHGLCHGNAAKTGSECCAEGCHDGGHAAEGHGSSTGHGGAESGHGSAGH
mmetsp:Transcript_95941/g.185040  ORF Transcript_95941/g.185040 Transcript_95941/m.185040 type:complete len:141 (+) Transcript_95941:100-522(+)